jgi:ammonium transporter Rh
MKALVNADFCAAAILISMGAVLGKTTLPQLFLLVTFETIFYTLNAVILLDLLKVADVGGAITIHMFGAFYGLAASYFFEPKKAIADERCKGGYNS